MSGIIAMTAVAAAEKIFKRETAPAASAEELAEDILGVEIGTSASTLTAGVGVMTELVILPPLLRIAQRLVSE